MNNKNVLIFLTDQQRYDSLGCTGNPYARTPNIDRLAQDGIIFTRHIASNTVCMPSRASLLTGMTVTGHRLTGNGVPLWRMGDPGLSEKTQQKAVKQLGCELPESIPTLADILTDHGYDTAMIGKLHLEPHLADKHFGFKESLTAWENRDMEQWEGPLYGFQKVRLITGHGESPCSLTNGHYGRWLYNNHRETWDKVSAGNNKVLCCEGYGGAYLSPIPKEQHNSMWLAEETCSYISEHKEQDTPFFAMVGFPDPHHPFTIPEDFGKDFLDLDVLEPAPYDERVGQKPGQARKAIEKNKESQEAVLYSAKVYAAGVALIDQAVGKIVECLKQSGKYEDTIIIFTSDHGEFLGDYGALKKSNCAFNCLLHVPFILKPFGKTEACRDEFPMSNADVVPTLLSMLNIPVPDHMQGKDIFATNRNDHAAYAACFPGKPGEGNFTIYDKEFRYTYYPSTGEEELYNHTNDPKELENLAVSGDIEAKDKCKAMKEKLLELHMRYSIGYFGRYGIW